MTLRDDELDTIMSTALKDDAAWTQLIADSTRRMQAEIWLDTHIASTDSILARRQADFTEYTATRYRRDFKKKLAEFQGWRARTVYFRELCVNRRSELRALSDPDLVADLSDAFAELASAVWQYEHHEIDDAELFGALDEIQLPADAGRAITARQKAQEYLRDCDTGNPDAEHPHAESA